MKLIKPSFEVKNPELFASISKDIEKVARTCYQSEGNICEGSDLKLLQKLLKSGHYPMIEFGHSPVVAIICDRGVSHELVRHRLCSFAQESTRYCNYAKDKHITFIIPPWVTCIKEGEYKSTTDALDTLFSKQDKAAFEWLDQLYYSQRIYNNLIDTHKWSPQQARAVLPNSLKTEINIKADLTEWHHIFVMRTSSAAHPQMREIMNPLLKEFQKLVPLIFDDIIPFE
jgi:thymidylate synthase (FAD)